MKALTQTQVEQYRRAGFLFPLPVLEPTESAALRERLEALERRDGGRLSPSTNRKPHLLLPWLNDLIRDPRILDPVEDILGPNLLCWASGFFMKNPRDPAQVTWHQDSTYWGLSEPDVVTAWVAFTPSTAENGCMRVIPGSQTSEQLPHRDTFAKDNLLTRGQEIAVEVDEAKAVDVELAEGQMSLHHVRLVHGSEPNRSASRRIGYAIRYLPTYVRQITGIPDSATLVRGRDDYGHFFLEPAPRSEFDPEAVALHARIEDASNKVLYRGAAKGPK